MLMVDGGGSGVGGGQWWLLLGGVGVFGVGGGWQVGYLVTDGVWWWGIW